jgi:hypothetical protein
MSGLDLGTLAGYHRRDLAHEMRTSRMAGTDGKRLVVTKNDAGRRNVICGVRTAVELLGVRLRAHHALQKGS